MQLTREREEIKIGKTNMLNVRSNFFFIVELLYFCWKFREKSIFRQRSCLIRFAKNSFLTFFTGCLH